MDSHLKCCHCYRLSWFALWYSIMHYFNGTNFGVQNYLTWNDIHWVPTDLNWVWWTRLNSEITLFPNLFLIFVSLCMYNHSNAVKQLIIPTCNGNYIIPNCFSLSFYIPIWKVSAIVSADLDLLYLWTPVLKLSILNVKSSLDTVFIFML